MKKLKLSFVLFASLCCFLSCKKEVSNPAPKSGKFHLLEISSPSLANRINQLIGVLSHDTSSQKTFFYGDFDANGKPKSLNYAVLSRGTDTSLHYSFDSLMRVKSIYVSINNVKDSIVSVFDYSSNGKKLRFYIVDWNTGTYKLKGEIPISVNGDVYSLGAYTSFRMAAHGSQKISEEPFDLAIDGTKAEADILAINAFIAAATVAVAVAVGSTAAPLALLIGIVGIFSNNHGGGGSSSSSQVTINPNLPVEIYNNTEVLSEPNYPEYAPLPPTQQTINSLESITNPVIQNSRWTITRVCPSGYSITSMFDFIQTDSLWGQEGVNINFKEVYPPYITVSYSGVFTANNEIRGTWVLTCPVGTCSPVDPTCWSGTFTAR
jgi:hypothetical protein